MAAVDFFYWTLLVAAVDVVSTALIALAFCYLVKNMFLVDSTSLGYIGTQTSLLFVGSHEPS
jgi:hypothetical protein